MNTQVNTVIFDIGNVLIGWDPRRLYRQLIDDEARKRGRCYGPEADTRDERNAPRHGYTVLFLEQTYHRDLVCNIGISRFFRQTCLDDHRSRRREVARRMEDSLGSSESITHLCWLGHINDPILQV